jgi:uncharacterized protein
MSADQIIAVLKRNEDALRARGVLHAALFGSRARGDHRNDSDTDIMIEVDPVADISIFDYVGLKEYISNLIGGRVDVVEKSQLKPYVASGAEADAINVF